MGPWPARKHPEGTCTASPDYQANIARPPAIGVEAVAWREKIADAVLSACRQYADTARAYVGERRYVHTGYIVSEATDAILAALPSVPVGGLGALQAEDRPSVPTELAGVGWQDISTAPKDRPILGWCVHDADPYFIEPEDASGRSRLTLYGGHTEGLSHVSDGPHVLVWGGAWDDSTHEYSGGWMPDWWFRSDSDFEVTANPILWKEIGEPPAASVSPGTSAASAPSLPTEDAAGGWQDISTAPKDGREVLVYRPLARLTRDEPVAIKRLIGGDNHCWPRTVPEGATPCNPTDGSCHVTHWMPLPAAPTTPASLDGGE